MNKHILFWGVPLVLAAAIGVLFYQLYLNEDDTLVSILEQDFQNLFSQETSVEAPVSQMKEKALPLPMSDSEPNEVMTASEPAKMPALSKSMKNEPLVSHDSGKKELNKMAQKGSMMAGKETPMPVVMAAPTKKEETKPPRVMASTTKNEMKKEKDALASKTEIANKRVPSKKLQPISGKLVKQPLQTEKFTEFSTLIEKDQNIWKSISRSQSKKLKSDQWKTIIIQNKRKLDYTIFPEVFDTKPHWDIIQNRGKLEVNYVAESNNQLHSKPSPSPKDNAKNNTDLKDVHSKKNPWKYVVQVMSTDRSHYEDAVTTVHRLVSDGYYAYVYRTKDKIKEKFWYRVRVGYYKTPEEAQAIGQEIYFRYRDREKFLPQNYWAVIPSAHELSREVVNISTQNNKPWVLEFPLYESRSKTLQDLPKLEEITELAYVSSQKQGKTTHFRIRSGFYKTQVEAQRNLAKLRKLHPSLGTPKIIKL